MSRPCPGGARARSYAARSSAPPRRPSAIAALVPIVAVTLPAAHADEADFLGRWLFYIDQQIVGFSYGTLEIERADGEIAAYIDGGPAPISIEDDAIALDFDWDDGGGTVYLSKLEGTQSDGRISGEVRRGDEEVGTWRATPQPTPPGIGEPPRPADFGGIWSMQTTDGTGKDTFLMTPEAAAYQQAFDARYDDPVLRCVSDGLVRLTGGPFAKEIIARDDEILILYEDMHEIRRIHIGGEFPEDVEYLGSPIGHSIGHWEGSTLVVETRGLKPALWHRAGGEPISDQAHIRELMYLGDDGRLHVELTLDDPVNYERSPQRHTVFARAPDYEFTYYECDPDAFYRALYLEEELDHYYDRSRYRR